MLRPSSGPETHGIRRFVRGSAGPSDRVGPQIDEDQHPLPRPIHPRPTRSPCEAGLRRRHPRLRSGCRCPRHRPGRRHRADGTSRTIPTRRGAGRDPRRPPGDHVRTLRLGSASRKARTRSPVTSRDHHPARIFSSNRIKTGRLRSIETGTQPSATPLKSPKRSPR